MDKFRKKQKVVEAVEWRGTNPFEVLDFLEPIKDNVSMLEGDDFFIIKTLEGNMKVTLGDWVIKGTLGEFYPCKPDVFHNVYEWVE